MSETTYILGHAPEELRRLELQATVLEPLTRRLLHDVGLSEGMDRPGLPRLRASEATGGVSLPDAAYHTVDPAS